MSTVLNPYHSFLGNQSPTAVIEASPQKLRELASELPDGRIDRTYAPGKWSARKIICHLADAEITFAFRLRQAIAETDYVIQPYNQDAWAINYGSCNPLIALNVFCTLRSSNVAFIAAQPPETMSKKLNHPERGPMTFQTVVETMAGHDLNHLRQLETIARQD